MGLEAVVLGAITTLLTLLSRKTGVNPKLICAVMALFAACIYTVYSHPYSGGVIGYLVQEAFFTWSAACGIYVALENVFFKPMKNKLYADSKKKK